MQVNLHVVSEFGNSTLKDTDPRSKPVPVNLHIVSPIHIGSWEKELVPGTDLVIAGKRAYVFDERKLLTKFKEVGISCDFLKEVHKNDFTIERFLKDKHLLNPKDLGEISSYQVHCPFYPGKKKIRPFIRDAFARPYIPGTVIKGAIRTAILWKMLKEDKRIKFEAEGLQRLRRELPPPWAKLGKTKKESIKSYVGAFLTPDFFQDYASRGKDRDAHTDLLRALEVRDGLPMHHDSLEIRLVKLVSVGDEGDGRGWHFSHQKKRGKVMIDWKSGEPLDIPIWIECMVPNDQNPIQTEVEIKVDQMIIDNLEAQSGKKVPSWCRSVDEIIGVCQEFTNFCIEQEEKKFFEDFKGVDEIKKFYDTVKPNLRIGWGSGLAETTILSLLPSDIRERVQNLFQSKENLFPKTRRVIIKDTEPFRPLGWIRLEVP